MVLGIGRARPRAHSDVDILVHAAQGRNQSHRKTNDRANRERGRKHRNVEPEGVEARQRVRRERHQRAYDCGGDAEPCDAAEQRQ